MSFSVRQRARALATLRFVEVRLMETLSRWVPTTPEMEVKILLGQHIWDHAQHADALGKRTQELRAPLHHTLEPVAAYMEVLDELDRLTDTRERIHGYYEIVLTGLDSRYQEYLSATDVLLDAPSVRVVTRILLDMTRMAQESRDLREQIPAVRLADAGWAATLSGMDSAAGAIVRPEETTARGAS